MQIINWIRDGMLIYEDKNKILAWSRRARLQLPGRRKPIQGSYQKILSPTEVVNHPAQIKALAAGDGMLHVAPRAIGEPLTDRQEMNYLKVYNQLFNIRKKEGKLTASQQALFNKAELALGQDLFFAADNESRRREFESVAREAARDPRFPSARAAFEHALTVTEHQPADSEVPQWLRDEWLAARRALKFDDGKIGDGQDAMMFSGMSDSAGNGMLFAGARALDSAEHGGSMSRVSDQRTGTGTNSDATLPAGDTSGAVRRAANGQ